MPLDSKQPTVPPQPGNKSPLGKYGPVAYVLMAFIAVIFISNLLGIAKRASGANKSSLPSAPSTATHPQVSGYQDRQSLQAKSDAQDQMRREQNAASAKGSDEIPGPEADTAPPMTPAQSQALYGGGQGTPQRTSAVTEQRAQAKAAALARAKRRTNALNSDTLAIDFTRGGNAPTMPAVAPKASDSEAEADVKPETKPDTQEAKADVPADGEAAPVAAGPVPSARAKTLTDTADVYTGKLYRVFEGTVLEGVVTNHINGALAGPILISLTTDYYSHDHQQLLLPQGTRLIGEIKSVSNSQQSRLVAVFHRAICPDGFSVNLEQYPGLDPLGTTGLSGKVDHGYLTAFTAAAAIGGLGGLTQIGNSGSILSSSTEIRNGISQQTGQEATQVLNHFLNRLPIITLKEGSRARVYIGRDIAIPSYGDHSVDPTL